MSWFDKVLEAVKTAAVIGERVERLGGAIADLAKDVREMDRRLSRLEGAYEASRRRTAPSSKS